MFTSCVVEVNMLGQGKLIKSEDYPDYVPSTFTFSTTSAKSNAEEKARYMRLMRQHKIQDRLHGLKYLVVWHITSEQNTDTEQCEATINTLCIRDVYHQAKLLSVDKNIMIQYSYITIFYIVNIRDFSFSWPLLWTTTTVHDIHNEISMFVPWKLTRHITGCFCSKR